jgi:hypothetical protein
MKKTNFDKYLDEQLQDPGFRERFRKAGKAWDKAIRERPGVSINKTGERR